jgi:hypothetical protein
VATGTKPTTAAKGHEVTWAQATRDVLIAAINRGQLPALCLGLAVVLMVWKLPDDYVGPLFNRVLSKLEDGGLLGWVLFLATLLTWYVHARKIRNAFVDALNNGAKPHPKGDDDA